MGKTEILADYLRGQARRQLDRVEHRDDGSNARSALALLDAAIYAKGLDDDDPLIVELVEAGCFGRDGLGGFDPGEEATKAVRAWRGGEPGDLLKFVSMVSRVQMTG
ncbi:hypothetical protein SAMN05421505_103227 [Sinosporangium album]|uniref:Uncharacterized protein n=1 Tax=Sinosporangium album TaxID=504805 RepID=A0A1G7TDG9_9ACTN|nr:hypothetical protein [Sinosporangium album]SDG33348.1 hypothetical protein SAMN05421505_103227 [Sinosporangium album]